MQDSREGGEKISAPGTRRRCKKNFIHLFKLGERIKATMTMTAKASWFTSLIERTQQNEMSVEVWR